MNRERMLFVGVVALIALWYFVLREPARVEGTVASGKQAVDVRPVTPVAGESIALTLPEPYGAFTQVTNERGHPRPLLPPVAERELPGTWPPTSASVRLKLLGRLRRETVAPTGDAASVQLPALEGNGNGGGVAPATAEDRIDGCTALGNAQQGKVLRIRSNNQWIRDPGEPPAAQAPAAGSFHQLLALCQIDQFKAQADGVQEIEFQLKQGGSVRYAFPKDINNIQAGIGGKHAPHWEGLIGYLRLPKAGAAPREQFGDRMLAAGKQAGGQDPRLEWALLAYREALAMTPNAPAARKRLVLKMLDAGGALYRPELVLQIAFDFLAESPGDEEVIVFVGKLLASRTFGLNDMAEQWFAKAERNAEAQKLRVGVLLRLDRFEDAQEILIAGRAGSGPEVDILAARTALALGDYDTATRRAQPHAAGEFAAEANLILGGVAYAKGDAASAEANFLAAVERDPRNSRAYSDLGLALAVQGKQADALLCFERATQLDFENTVTPALGRLYLEFAAADAAAAHERKIRDEMAKRKNTAEFEKPLAEAQQAQSEAIGRAAAIIAGDDGLESNNPLNLLVRYYAGYTLERQGELRAAYDKYRSVIDSDHRYRIAIARLGFVLARFLEAQPDDPKAEEYAKAADAHLTKSQELNPTDPVVPYVLARFHMLRGTRTAKADRMFEVTAGLPAPAGDVDLPNWAAAGRAALAYRNEDTEVNAVKSMFLAVQNRLRQRISLDGPADLEKALAANEVHAYCADCLARIAENQGKRVIDYQFRNVLPKEWELLKREPAKINPGKEGIQFGGDIDNKGAEAAPFEHNAMHYPKEGREINRNTFHEMIVEGVVPEASATMNRVDFGVGVVIKRRARNKGDEYRGIRIKRTPEGRVELEIDGAREIERLKDASRGGVWSPTKAEWPAGPFRLRIEVSDRDKGFFRIWLQVGDGKEVNVLAAAFPEDGKEEEATRLLGRGGGGGPFQFYIWIDGADGAKYGGFFVKRVSLVKGTQ